MDEYLKMYEGIPFSPVATLTQPVNEADTIIHVSDSGVFPEGPNYATIGSDENAETVLYAQKAPGLLSGCTRGVEGIARAWQAEEVIARNFTGLDYRALHKNMDKAISELSEKANTVNNQFPDAKGNIELTAEHIPVKAAGMDAGTVQEAVRILKKDGDEVREYFTPEGAAKNANALNGIPGENYLPEKITDLTGAKSYEYAAPMACVARPSFIGRTVQEGTPSPGTPAPVKGVLNPWIKATTEDGTVVTKQLTGELFDGDSFDGVNVVKRMKNWQVTVEDCNFFVTTWATSPEIIAFCGKLPADFYESPTVVKCNTFILEGANDTETIQTQGGFKVLYLFIKKSRLAGWSDSLLDKEKTAALKNWLDENPTYLLYELDFPEITRRDMDLALSPSSWTIEAGDENELLESVSIEVLPDSAVYGRRVYPYQHMKEGTVHKLTGTPGAEQIIFRTTGAYQDGDTWTLNGAAVAVTYNDGQALLPTAVIAGDVVEAVIEGGVLRLILQKPTPQPNILVNGLFGAKHLVNQRRQSEYTTDGYTIDMWLLWNSGKVTLADNGITLFGADKESTFFQLLPAVAQDETITISAKLDGKIYTASGEPRNGLHQLTPNGNIRVYVHGGHNMALAQVGISGGKSVLATSFKIEYGPRFTGWYEPKPGETLAECQRYLLRNSSGNTTEIRASYIYNGGITFTVPIPTAMRTSPAISTALENSIIEVRNMSNTTQSGFTFSTIALPGAIKIIASKANHGLSDALLVMRNVLFTAEL